MSGKELRHLFSFREKSPVYTKGEWRSFKINIGLLGSNAV
jgi:hypothetical protein